MRIFNIFCFRALCIVWTASMFGACAFVNSARQPRPIQIECVGSKLDLYQKAKEALERHNYKIRVDKRVEGVLKAYRTPEQVHFGDQTIFNGALYVEATVDSASVTLFIYRVMEIPAEGREPAIEVSYDEKNSTLYTRPLFQPLSDDVRRSCAYLNRARKHNIEPSVCNLSSDTETLTFTPARDSIN